MHRKLDYTAARGVAPDGYKAAAWDVSTEYYAANRIGTPGGQHFESREKVPPTVVPYSAVIINEVGNLAGMEYDWIELRNVTDAAVNVKNWHIGSIAAKGDDKILVKFPGDDHYTIPALGYILVVATDPYNDPQHPLATGTKWNKGTARLGTVAASSTYYVADGADDTFDTDGLGTGESLLVLRSGYDKAKPNEKIIDLTGTKYISDTGFDTDIWPLKGTDKGDGDVFEGDEVAEKFEEGKVFHRAKLDKGTAEHTWKRAGHSGFGYKRSHEDGSTGSPGYADGLVKAKSATLADNTISISEIMYETANNAPQWIELYNNSATEAINLNEWKLMFENADDADVRIPAVTTNNLPGKIIQPKQTVLVVSRKTGSTSRESSGRDDFPDTRIINLWDQKDKLEVSTIGYKLLSTEAFRITLMQKGHTEAAPLVADVAGNMGDDGMAMWTLPASERGEGRSSIIRRYDTDDVARDGTTPAWYGQASLEDQGIMGGTGNAGWGLLRQFQWQ